MKTILTIILSAVLAMFTSNVYAFDNSSSPEYSLSYKKASLSISNKSEYTLTIKIMRNNGGGLYTTLTIPAKSSRTVYFSQSGSFYTKMKAEKGVETLYKQDSPFSIQCDSVRFPNIKIIYPIYV